MFWDLIYELAADRGMTVLVTTHYMDEAEQCDRLAFILDGAIIADGSPTTLKSHLARPTVRGRDRARRVRDARDAASAAACSRTCTSRGGGCAPCCADGAEREAIARLGAQGPAREAEPSLEDVFVSLARKRAPGAEEAA